MLVQHYGYLATLVFSLCGVAYYDLMHTCVCWKRSSQAAVFTSTVFLLVCDIIGIHLSIFHTNPAYVSGVTLGSPDLPLEELILLIFLAYLVLVLKSVFTEKI